MLINVLFFWFLFPVDDALGNQSRPGTRLSDRSSTRQSRRSSIESESAALDYTHLEQSGADEYEADAQFSDNEVDQFLQSLKEEGKLSVNIFEKTQRTCLAFVFVAVFVFATT